MSAGTATLGEALVAFGTVIIFVSAALNVHLRNGSTVRAIGRVCLRVAGVLTRPLTWPFRAFHRSLTTEPGEVCARRDHRRTWDGHAEWCRRCGVDSYPDVELPDPTVEPGPIVTRRWSVRASVDVEGLKIEWERGLREVEAGRSWWRGVDEDPLTTVYERRRRRR